MSGVDPAEIFRQEASELVEVLEQGLLDLGETPEDGELVDSCFRALHTIKGSGAMFGFTQVADFVHEFETAFDRVRKGEAPATPELIAVALRGKDHVQHLVEGQEVAAETGESIIEALRAAVGTGTAAAPAAAAAAAKPAAPAGGGAGWRIRFSLPADALSFGANPLLLLEELGELGSTEVRAGLKAVPVLADLDPEVCHVTWEVTLRTPRERSAVEDVFMFLQDGMELSIEPLADEKAEAPQPKASVAASPAPAAASPAPAAPAKKAAAPAARDAKPAGADKGSSLRVPAERLDELMDRVGELVIAQARLTQIAGGSGDPMLKTIAEELERLSSGLRDTTMGIRMVPIGQLFGRFRRLVHDLSSELGKDIDFVTTGEDTELDKTMIERLADPLVHIIRNSLDHGIEAPEARRAAGKPGMGNIRLSAIYTGAEVAITVSDDGNGLDADRIRHKAIDSGLIAPEAKISDQEVYQLIFEPGFSTAEVVSALSGRGVGMDVVKRTIDGLRGNIEVGSVAGEGTKVTLRLPLTLAIIDGLLVQVGEGRYVIPLPAVEECLELPEVSEVSTRGWNVLEVRGDIVPFLRLRELFGAGGEPDEYQKMVVVGSGESRVGLVVDQIIGKNQTVIKQLSSLHAGIKSFSGATILGDGTVALILDATHLVTTGQAYEERRSDATRGRAA